MDQPDEIHDSHLRSLLKGLTWRVTATAATVAIAYGVTGHAALALQIGGIEVVAKIGIYYVHERAWERVPRRSGQGTRSARAR